MQKSILITGCSSGIGYRAAQLLKERDYRVFATARKQEDVNRLCDEGFESLRLDVDEPDSISAAVAAILTKTNGSLYALLNNAGYGQAGALEDLSRDALRQQFETNVIGLFDLTRRIIPVMRQQGFGRILNMSSILGLVALPYRGAYCASKFAIEGLSDALRLELHGSNIFVSLIEPGPIASNFRKHELANVQLNVDTEKSFHKKNYQSLVRLFRERENTLPFTLPPDAVVKKIVHALESKKPKPRYYVTLPTYFMASIRRILPTSALDFVLRHGSNGELNQ